MSTIDTSTPHGPPPSQDEDFSWVPPVVNLTPEMIETIGEELDAIYDEVYASLGADDEAYIRGLIKLQRGMAFGARVAMTAGGWLGRLGGTPGRRRAGRTMTRAGMVTLGLAKILENMEIGHNVMHGQWDWMQDPDINSTVWEWDNVCPADQWKHGHNVLHHTYTNVLGMDRDIGYEIFRITDEQRWHPVYIAQPVYNALLMLLFEWGVGVHEVDIHALRKGGMDEEKRQGELRKLQGFAEKASKQVAKDYVLWPALAGPGAVDVAKQNAIANVIRNIWTYVIIYCGHFPDDTHVFAKDTAKGESRGAWYLRQILGSANIDGGKTFNVMTGQLSHQIEHHLFPDMPSNRLPAVAPRVRSICERYDIPYNHGSLSTQFGSVVRKIFRYALP